MSLKTINNSSRQLNHIRADILDNDICPELASGATQLVFGEGNPDADIVFVGEAPGKNEDQQGVPFVGSAGKLLDEMLNSIGLDRADVYITNIVKYRPPNNRDPKTEEKEAFLPFLWQQIEAINPLVIITLGRHSMECFLPNQRISQAHGQSKRITVKKSDGSDWPITIMPLYHPAAVLYNGGLRDTLFTDFSAIPEVINTLKQSA